MRIFSQRGMIYIVFFLQYIVSHGVRLVSVGGFECLNVTEAHVYRLPLILIASYQSLGPAVRLERQ